MNLICEISCPFCRKIDAALFLDQPSTSYEDIVKMLQDLPLLKVIGDEMTKGCPLCQHYMITKITIEP